MNHLLHNYYKALGGKYIPPIKVDPPRKKGRMVYTEKTGGFIEIYDDPEVFAEVKSDDARVANQSKLRRKAPNGGRQI